MKKFIAKAALAAGLFAVGLGSSAIAQDLDKSVKARRGYFQAVLYNAGILFGMAKGEVEYDATRASRAAASLKALSDVDAGLMFPEGTDNGALAGQTRALPVIWTDGGGISEKAKAFGEAADGLVASAGQGLESLQGSVGALGASCKGCHDTYRAKDF